MHVVLGRQTGKRTTIWLKQNFVPWRIVRHLLGLLLALLMLSSVFAGCLGAASESESGSQVVTYPNTNATIVEVWEDGELVETQYPVLTFDFSQSTASGPLLLHTVKGDHVLDSVDPAESQRVEVEFKHHGFHLLELITEFEASSGEQASPLSHREEVVVRIEKRIEWSESATNNPMPMPIDTRYEAGSQPAIALVIESTVLNPDLIANIGGGRDVEVYWELIDSTQSACQSQPGTVGEGDSATWKTVDFDTSDAHELRVNYEEGQDAIEIDQTVLIQYEALESPISV